MCEQDSQKGVDLKKIDELKINLIVWKRTKSIEKAYNICDWLYAELIGRDGKTTDATPKKYKIESKK